MLRTSLLPLSARHLSTSAPPPPAPTELRRFTRPKYKGWADVAVIFTIFGITGTSSMFVVRPLLRWLASLSVGELEAAAYTLFSGPWWFRIMYFVVMTPIYSAILLSIARLFGRHDYFYQRVIAGMWGLLLPLPRRRVLNGFVVSPAASSSSATGIADAANRAARALLGAYDQLVDYDAVKRALATDTVLMQALADLAALDAAALTPTQRTALFINVYNALTVHGIVELRPRPTPLRRLAFFSSAAYYVGPYELTLSDIEHGILRANSPHPVWGRGRYWGVSDPRTLWALPVLDARIHFALNCASLGCPRIRVYSAEHLDDELEVAARAFCALEVHVDAKSGQVSLSKIFEWYAGDFAPQGTAQPAELVRALRRWLAPPQQAALDQLLAAAPQTPVSLLFRDYAWETNAAPK